MTADLPSVSSLLENDVVLMSESRFKSEVMQIVPLAGTQPSFDADKVRRTVKENIKQQSRLLSVHWRRLVIDEGHAIGLDNTITSHALKLHVDHCWIISGTPTKNFTIEVALPSSTPLYQC